MTTLKQAQAFNTIQGSLLALKTLIKKYEFVLKEESNHQPLELLCASTFPILESLSTKFMSNYVEQSAKTLNTIFQTYYAAIHMELPTYF